ncbi:MAG: chemotaxis protein CheA [Pontiellaceae bacterium]|nr:chemotaxis protein CheA [Pontiellaceae bacterium]MBN2785804.1 chemotaxis protein CheA [Pontiellaceae bacterium]
MAECTRLTELVEASSAAFGLDGPPDKEELSKLMTGLVELLADGESLDIKTVDIVWQASRKLQGCISAGGELQNQILGEVYQELLKATGKGAEEAESTSADSEEAETAPRDYVIPQDDLPLIEDFITEATEHLEAAEGGMLDLEDNPESSDTLNLIFRSFHTIKGMAGFMNLEEIGLLTHNAENLLDLARKGSIPLTNNNADAIFKSIDMLKQMVSTLRDAVEADGVVASQAGLKELAEYLRQCAEGEESEAPEAAVEEEAEEAEPIEETEEPVAVIAEAAPAPNGSPVAATPAAARKASNIIDEKIKVSTGRLDNLVNMVGELVIAQLMVSESLRRDENSEPELLRNTAHQGKIIRELQELAMSMRMVPIGGVFQKMARMTRDLSKQANKPINLLMEGETTELDRTIVDKLADPLVHMIRNSVDHGIESAEDRKAADKPRQGTIMLKAYHSAGCIVIEICDDGRGLNRAKLLEKAIERGIIAPDQNPSDQEIFMTIFQPGLSTAAKITKISGRGVGMDVVRRNIEELRGRIDISSEEGEGTTFTVTLPLTLAVIDGQMVRVGGEKYIIPINNIRRSFRPKPEEISTVQGRREMVMVRDELLPLVRLHELFGVVPDSINPSESLVVIVEEDNEACCLLVDDLLDQQQVVIKGLGPLLNQTVGVSGGAIMGDGMVRLILDIPGVIKLFRS